MAALLIFAASCKKEKNEQIDEPTGEECTFSAKTETHNGGSKTYLDGLAVKWENGDRIKVINGSTPSEAEVFTLSEYLDDGSTAKFKADVEADFFKPDYIGLYPSSLEVNGGACSFSLSSTQTYAAGSFAAGCNPMTAKSNNKSFFFRNACGLLELNLYGAGAPVKIISITVRSKKSTDKLWGSGNIDMETGVFTVTSTESNQDVITLNCNNAPVGTKKGEMCVFLI